MVTGYRVTVTAAGAPLDIGRIPRPMSIVHGRSTIASQPDAPTCAFTWNAATPPAQLGDEIVVAAVIDYTPATYDDPTVTYDDPSAVYDSPADGGVVRPRFVGHVDSLTPHEAGGQITSWDVGCIGVQAALGSRPVLLSRPVETDVARVAAISAAAGIPVTITGSPGVQLAADNIDTDALAALHQVCGSTGGLLWQSTDGRVVYGTAEHRRGVDYATIDAHMIGDGLDWAQATESIVNEVTAIWGPEDGQEQETHRDTASIEQPWGLRHTDVTTICAAEPDAEHLALLILRRRAWPYWGTPTIVVYADRLSPAQTRALAALDVSAGIRVPLPLAEPGPTPSEPSLGIVEGWVETWGEHRHTVQLSAGDAARWVDTRLRTWGEVRDGGTWADWAAGSWADQIIAEDAA